MGKVWYSASEAPSMIYCGEELDHLLLVVVRVLHDGKALFEQWDYTPSIDGPWDTFVKDHRVKLWAKAGWLLRAAREEAKV